MSFEEPNNPRSSEIANNQIQLTELATYEERTPGYLHTVKVFGYITFASISLYLPPAHRVMYSTKCIVSDNDRCYFKSVLSITAMSTSEM